MNSNVVTEINQIRETCLDCMPMQIRTYQDRSYHSIDAQAQKDAQWFADPHEAFLLTQACLRSSEQSQQGLIFLD